MRKWSDGCWGSLCHASQFCGQRTHERVLQSRDANSELARTNKPTSNRNAYGRPLVRAIFQAYIGPNLQPLWRTLVCAQLGTYIYTHFCTYIHALYCTDLHTDECPVRTSNSIPHSTPDYTRPNPSALSHSYS